MSSPTLLCCPHCHSDQVHIYRVYALESATHAEEPSSYGELYGIPVSGVSGHRRGTLIIEAWCEENHRFQLHFIQHKGTTFIETRLCGDHWDYALEQPR